MRGPTRTTLFPYTTLFRSPKVEILKVPSGRISPEPLIFSASARSETSYPASALGSLPSVNFTRPLTRSEEHTSELQSHSDLVCRLLLEQKTHAAGTTVQSN